MIDNNLTGKIALGTVQFGLDYGISNNRGKIKQKQANEILKYAYDMGIKILDTAYAYGNSEEVLGSIINKEKLKFDIISKLPSGLSLNQIFEIFNQSLTHLNTNLLYGYIFHNFQDLKKQQFYDELRKIKDKGFVKKIGVSLYYPEEYEWIIKNNIKIDLIQIPFNIFDHRFEPYFQDMKANNVEIHVRSVFLQGLFFLDSEYIDLNFNIIKDKLNKIKKISKKNSISISSLLLNFVLTYKEISKVVIGITSHKELKENLKNLEDFGKIKKIKNLLSDLTCNDENIILPFNWRKNNV